MSPTILFDLDGTLVDTAPDLGLALNLQRERHGLPPLPQEIIRPYASHGTVGLFDIGKTRSDEFLNQVEKRMAERGIRTKRYAKPTNAKVAPREVVDKVVAEADLVLIGLSD